MSLGGCSVYTESHDAFLEQHHRCECTLTALSLRLFGELWFISPMSFFVLGCVSHFRHYPLDECLFQGKGRKMWSESECVTFMPLLIIHLIHQAGPLDAFDLYFCTTSLSLHFSSPPFFPHHLSITFWPFPTLLISLPSSWVIHNSCPQHFLLWSFSSLFLLNVLVFFFSLLLSWPL